MTRPRSAVLAGGTAILAAAWPAAARAQLAPADPVLATYLIWWAAIASLLLAAGAVVGALWHRRRVARMAAHAERLKGEAETLGAVLALSGGEFLYWRSRDALPKISAGLPGLLGLPTAAAADFSAVGPWIAAADQAGFDRAVRQLREQGTPFTLEIRLPQAGRVVRVEGRPAAHGGALLWFEDATAAAGREDRAVAERDHLRALLDSLPLPVWSRRPDLSLSWCSLAYARLLDSTREAVLASSAELASGAIADGGRALARRARDLGLPQSESRHLVVEGHVRLFDFTEQPLADGGLAGYARDMTGLESTQAELAHHIAAHAEVLEHLGTGIVIFGPDSRVKFFNSAYAEQFRLDEAMLRDEPTMGEVFEAMRERRRLPEHADFPAYKRELQRQLMGIIAPHEELVHLPDGSTLRMVAAPHPFGGVLVTYEDVTDTLALESSYNTLIAVQRETLDHLYEGVAVFGGDGRLKLSNPAFAKLWGLDPVELRNEPHVGTIVEKARPFFGAVSNWQRLRDRIVSRVADREPRSGRLERADGSVIDYAAVPLPDGACLFTYLDVTDSSRVERALRERNAALETADRLKSEFIANVSYELRTPLNAIIGFAEILDLQYFGPLNERQLEYSRGIVEASQRLLSLINDILDVASIEAGYLKLEQAPVDIRALVANLQTLAYERARNRSLTMTVACPPDIGTVLADERRLKQALYNLLSNAINFTPEGGRVTLSVRREGEGVAFVVADTGIGIAPEDQAKVFEKFTRAAKHGPEGGVGLGLSLVKSLIELHGGTVELESRAGAGTRVTCYLPAAVPRSDAA